MVTMKCIYDVGDCWWMSREMEKRKRKRKRRHRRGTQARYKRNGARRAVCAGGASGANHREAAAIGLAISGQSRGVSHSSFGGRDWMTSPGGHPCGYIERPKAQLQLLTRESTPRYPVSAHTVAFPRIKDALLPVPNKSSTRQPSMSTA